METLMRHDSGVFFAGERLRLEQQQPSEEQRLFTLYEKPFQALSNDERLEVSASLKDTDVEIMLFSPKKELVSLELSLPRACKPAKFAAVNVEVKEYLSRLAVQYTLSVKREDVAEPVAFIVTCSEMNAYMATMVERGAELVAAKVLGNKHKA